MPTTTNGVPVKYIGREDPFYDRLYSSNLPFSPGQVRVINDLDLVAKFLRHSDCFERADTNPAAPVPTAPQHPASPASDGSSSESGVSQDGANPQTPPVPAGDVVQSTEGSKPEQVDDTEDRLAAAKKLSDTQKLAEQNRLDLVQSLDSMDKDALQAWGVEKFSQKVPKNLSVENMRARIVEMIDQYGVP